MRGDVLAAAGDDDILDPALDGEEAVLHDTEVARQQPEPAVERLPRLGRVAQVTHEHIPAQSFVKFFTRSRTGA